MAVAMAVKKWTLAELHRLPDDGNKYELVRGELFVTPPPGEVHETVLAKLNALLTPYVSEHGLGFVYHPRAVVRYDESEVEPDLMVRQPHPKPRRNDKDWDRAPIPILVVEVISLYTRRRDFKQKKQLYLDAGVAEYWIVDEESRTITVVTKNDPDGTEHEREVTWSPAGASTPLTFDVSVIF